METIVEVADVQNALIDLERRIESAIGEFNERFNEQGISAAVYIDQKFIETKCGEVRQHVAKAVAYITTNRPL